MENIVLNNSDPESSIVKHNAEEKIMMKIEEFRNDVLLMKKVEKDKEIKRSFDYLKQKWFYPVLLNNHNFSSEEKKALERLVEQKARKILRWFWWPNIVVATGIIALSFFIHQANSLWLILQGIVSVATYITIDTSGRNVPSLFQHCANALKYKKIAEQQKI